MRRPCPLLPLLGLLLVVLSPLTWAHDIPNARVDRTIQVTLSPGLLRIDYEVSLSELTLSRDLRDLIGTLPDGDRQDWFHRYGQETGPLNAKGMLVSVDGRPLLLQYRDFQIVTEEHPQFTFHFEADLPARGRLKVQDTNFVSSEGTSRLALRARNGLILRSDSLPTDVQLISPVPLWMMSDLEERRSKQAELDFHTIAPSHLKANKFQPRLETAPSKDTAQSYPTASRSRDRTPREDSRQPDRAANPLTRLLDRRPGTSPLGLLLVAFGLGAAHAFQPGHGKTLVAATVVAGRGNWIQGALLALITAATHTGSVLLVALGLWLSRSTRYAAVHAVLTYSAGMVIAAIGFWRLGRHLGGYGEHENAPLPPTGVGSSSGNLVGLGVAGGIVPCWDAVALIIVAEALGRLGLGLVLVVCFGMGMATTLVGVGLVAVRCRQHLAGRGAPSGRLEHWIGIVGSLVLCGMGLYLLSLA